MAEEASVAIVTGGAQGLGAAICSALLGLGYKVCVGDINEAKGKEFVAEQQKEHGEDKIAFACCDVTQEADYARIFDVALKEFGKVAVLVNNAGIILEHDPKKTLEVNLLGPIIGCQAALKYMGKSSGGKGGMVINTASICASLSRGEGRGEIFTALCPFFIDTDLLKTSGETTLVQGLDFTKRPNLMSPEYVAQGVVKLLEDRINGATLGVTHFFGYRYIGYQKEFEDVPLE